MPKIWVSNDGDRGHSIELWKAKPIYDKRYNAFSEKEDSDFIGSMDIGAFKCLLPKIIPPHKGTKKEVQICT